ncbi:hypothetical protein Patl1_33273 [Pistacia atlantica]|uniref:Uncharacterized protein n=1 Tax=Pistacia atlantica TaxID=434234 RepID=A0ACC1ARN3_9ROSI|nr:hypothetical protein Patl1_33273 [Pistacia atlantica]
MQQDNLSRGNMGAVKILQKPFAEPRRLQFIYADLGDAKSVLNNINLQCLLMLGAQNAFDAVIHFAAVAYVAKVHLNLLVLEAMAARHVNTLIYSRTCATYGEPLKMPITEQTPQMPINPYGKAKKMSEDIIIDFSKTTNMAVMTLRAWPSGACFGAARGIIPGLKVRGTDYKTANGTCIRDYIDVTDLVDAHVLALPNAKPRETWNL